ncbi:hypothetical protein [Vibrio sp. H11]|uniref:hypothetical protein n=1 Tax=Vibrio sp. H11 TaxID=2565928 RepID=UPI0010A5FA93|nr:hypothetical protein [Vibrio sp. H11]
MNPVQLTINVVRPTLQKLGLYSRAAEQLVVGTIYQESRAEYLVQLNHGPALGLVQMEPATYHDIWNHFLAYNRPLANKITELAAMESLDDDMLPHPTQLVTNLAFAVAMCRVHYWRVKEPLPAAGDVPGLAAYWKAHYNTELGDGTEAEFIKHFPLEILQC